MITDAELAELDKLGKIEGTLAKSKKWNRISSPSLLRADLEFVIGVCRRLIEEREEMKAKIESMAAEMRAWRATVRIERGESIWVKPDWVGEIAKLKKELHAKRTLTSLLEHNSEMVSEADDWVTKIRAFRKEYMYPSSGNLSYEESQRIVLRFFEECDEELRNLGLDALGLGDWKGEG